MGRERHKVRLSRRAFKPLRDGQALNLSEDIGLHVLYRQRGRRAVEDLQQARRAGGADAVDTRSMGEFVRLARAESGVALVGGQAGVVEHADVVPVVEELGKQLCLIRGEVVACQLMDFGWRGGEELLCDYQLAGSPVGLNHNLNVQRRGAVHCQDGGVEEGVRTEVCKDFIVEVASVVGCRGEGALCDAVERVGVEVLEHIDRADVKEGRVALIHGKRRWYQGRKVVLVQKYTIGKEEVRRHGVRKVETRLHGWVLLELDGVALECRSNVRCRWSCVVGSLSRGEVDVCADRIGQAERFQRDIEAGKIVFDNLGLGEGNDAEINGNGALGINIGLGVASKIIVLLDDHYALVVILQPDGGIHACGASANGGNVPYDDILRIIRCRVEAIVGKDPERKGTQNDKHWEEDLHIHYEGRTESSE